MPIGWGRQPSDGDSQNVNFADAVLASDEVFEAGHAVALVYEGDPLAPTYRLCGASSHARQFIGFLKTVPVAPQKPTVTTGRGSRVLTPLVEGGAPLTPSGTVWLAATPGEVTQVPPGAVPGSSIIRVGFAQDTTTMILNTDVRVEIP